MKKIIFSFSLLSLFLVSTIFANQLAVPLMLKERQPNWRAETIKAYPNGVVEMVVFYEPSDNGELPVKQMSFYENGKIRQEVDVELVDENSETYKIWNSRLVPSGMCVDFSLNNTMEKIANYDKGLLEGEVKTFYSENRIQTLSNYVKGVLDGKIISFFENGNIKEEGTYKNGKLEGDYALFHPNQAKAAHMHYKGDMLHGKMIQWYENGAVKSEKLSLMTGGSTVIPILLVSCTYCATLSWLPILILKIAAINCTGKLALR